MYKNLIDRDEVNVHTDYRTYATELVNFLTAIIAMRGKKKLVSTGLWGKYSHKQLFRNLSKYKMVRGASGGPWVPSTWLKYINEICATLGI